MSPSELERMLEAAESPKLRLLIAIMGLSGARISEALSLTWGDVQGPTGELGSSIRIQGRKGGGIRHTPMSSRLRSELDRYRAELSMGALGLPWAPSVPLLSGRDFGTRWSRSAASASLATLVRRLGFERVSSHSARKFFASELLNTGATLRDTQELLGHANIGTTSRYLDVPKETRLQQAVSRIGG